MDSPPTTRHQRLVCGSSSGMLVLMGVTMTDPPFSSAVGVGGECELNHPPVPFQVRKSSTAIAARVLDCPVLSRMHDAARVWPPQKDRQLRRRNAQRFLLDGNAGALLVNRFEQQLL